MLIKAGINRVPYGVYDSRSDLSPHFLTLQYKNCREQASKRAKDGCHMSLIDRASI